MCVYYTIWLIHESHPHDHVLTVLLQIFMQTTASPSFHYVITSSNKYSSSSSQLPQVNHQLNPWDATPALQTWAGIVYLVYRSLLLLYIWYQLWHIYRQEEDRTKLVLYVFLGVAFTVWFWYLPILVFGVTFVNSVIRELIIQNVIIAMNYLVKTIFVFLLCPRWSNKYFQFHSHINSLGLLGARMFKNDYTLIREKTSGVL